MKEPKRLLLSEITNRLRLVGWHRAVTQGTRKGPCKLFIKRSQVIECDVKVFNGKLYITSTRYCPLDLLDGELAALDSGSVVRPGG